MGMIATAKGAMGSGQMMPRWSWFCGIAGHDVADVGHLGLGQVAAPVDAREVETLVVGTGAEVAHRRHGAVGHDAQFSWPTGPSDPGGALSRARISASVAKRKGFRPF